MQSESAVESITLRPRSSASRWVIWGMNSITIIYAITRGGPANRTLITPIQIFRLAFENASFNQAAALSVIFFAVTIVIVFVYIRVLASQPGEAR